MATLISATDLARKLGDYLARVRYRRESFIVERNGRPVARVVPIAEQEAVTLSRAMAIWCGAAPRDPSFADDFAAVGAADAPPENPWDS